MMTVTGAKELQNSSLWREVESEIDHRVAALLQSLMTCKPDELESTRTRIQCLNELKNLPTTVIEREQ
jgi:hypothetical protein